MTNCIKRHKTSLRVCIRISLPLLLLVTACVEAPPQDVLDYESCLKFNTDPIEPTGDDDPHLGYKSVYGCHVDVSELAGGPSTGYPDGTLIVKTSTREDQDFVWLLASMRKTSGRWEWAEYTRNFPDEKFARIPVEKSVCIDCHVQVEPIDWVFTSYQSAIQAYAK